MPSFDGTIANLGEKGHSVLFGGEYNGVTFAYLSTDRESRAIAATAVDRTAAPA